MKNLKILIRLLLNTFLFPMYYISGFIPRKKSIIVYGCPRDGFSDNAKYAYLQAIQENKDNKTRYWITSNLELLEKFKNHSSIKILNRWSLKGMWITLIAGTYVYSSYVSDINFWFSRKAYLINYWHGIPLKHIEFDIYSGSLSKRYNPKNLSDKIISLIYFIYHPAVFVRPDLLCNPLPKFNKIFTSAFRVEKENIFSKPYPRWNYILENSSHPQDTFTHTIFRNYLEKEKKIILYLPTFRDSGSSWIEESLLNHLNEIEDALHGKNTLFLVKLHPNESINIYKNYQNLFFVDSKLDIYPLLTHAQIVMTDYSSIMIDSVICKKNVILYWPDYNEFNSNSRDSYFDLKSIFGKKPITTPFELIQSINQLSFSPRFVNSEIQNEFLENFDYVEKK